MGIIKPVCIPMNWDGRDVLDVFDHSQEVIGERIGQVGCSADGWAAYAANPHTGAIRTTRLGTYDTIAEAVTVIDEHRTTDDERAAPAPEGSAYHTPPSEQ